MDEFADLLSTIFDEGIFGDNRSDRRREPAIVYQRFLCGGPKQLNINDR